jgi:crotonobetainyl-CoA:carnitine CoA-transferase CaiB-like acyl-CoA transferase
MATKKNTVKVRSTARRNTPARAKSKSPRALAKSNQALDGLRVLDCATYIAGPYCATIFAEFGAEVIKIEMPGVGDMARKLGTQTPVGDTLVWLSEARNKKSLTLNLKNKAGAQVLKQLVKHADVLIENFQPGTLESWGLGWQTLRRINPRLVMVRISAFGQTGPLSPRPGFGRIANAFGGISYLAGFPDRPPVTPGSATLADYLSGIYGAIGAFVALQALERTGKGQVVDIGLYESIFRILDELAPAYHYKGTIRQRMGPGTVNVVPHSHYPTQDNRWVAIACTNDKIFARLAVLMGCPQVAGAGKWGTIQQREADRAAVDAFVTEWTMRFSRGDLIGKCDSGEVPCGPVYAIDEIFEDPQFKARENIKMVKESRIPGATEFAVPNVMPRLTGTPGKLEWLGPALGAHTEAVLKGWLSMSAANIAKLRAAGAI